jgi:hypothetical protein
MKLIYNLPAIMRHAHSLLTDARLRGDDSAYMTFAYCLKCAWRAAKADRSYILAGVTVAPWGFCIVMEG